MAEYHYKYTGGDPSRGSTPPPAPTPSPNNNQNRNSNNDGVALLFIILALFFFPPVGLFLLILRLCNTSRSPRSTVSGTTYRYSGQQSQKTAAQTSRSTVHTTPSTTHVVKTGQTGQTQSSGGKAKDGKKDTTGAAPFLISGGILSGAFGLAFLSALAKTLVNGDLRAEIVPLVILACFLGTGLGLLKVGFSRRKKARLYKKYQVLIGNQDSVSISAIAKASGRSPKRVRADLQDMLDKGILPTGYLDLSQDKLILSSEGLEDREPAQPAQQAQDDVLSEIRAINNDIEDPEMSAKIDRIEAITGRILEYQNNHPEKAGQLHTFLSYYLPTTLKILRAYAQLEKQGIEGENISAAKSRIEGMMDQVVEGFEKQLDRLFQGDAIDISSDVAVLEQMLNKDGLGSGGFAQGT